MVLRSLYVKKKWYFFCSGVSIFGTTVAISICGIIASRHLHMDLLMNVLRSPMSFFECTPSGNLLNRFVKEIDAIDCMVPEGLKMMLSYAFKLLEVCIIVLMATPFAAVIILPLAFLYTCVQVYGPLFSAPMFMFESGAVDGSVTVLLAVSGLKN